MELDARQAELLRERRDCFVESLDVPEGEPHRHGAG
jgi:hypothetical protein